MRSAPARRTPLARLARRKHAQMVPRPVGDGRFVVDGTWGAVQPWQVAPGVVTIGELRLLAHIERGLPLIDTRQEHFYAQATIPGARSIPREAILEHIDEFDRRAATVFFCNGPQCKATPDAIHAL